MASGFGGNSDGEGFSFDDDSDLNEMLEIASRGEVDPEENGDSDIYFTDDGDIAETVVAAPQAEPVRQRTRQTEAARPQPVTEPVYVPEPVQAVAEPVYKEPVYVAPEPIKPVAPKYDDKPSFNNRPLLRKEGELISETKKIINILDKYRELSEEIKYVVCTFVYDGTNENEEVDINDEAKLVVKVLNADPMISTTMSNLKATAEQKDRVERVFFILRLPKNELTSLGLLVGKIVEKEITGEHDNIGFSKNVEAAINTLDKNIIQYVTATESVLNAAG